jgi:hypothetical protein
VQRIGDGRTGQVLGDRTIERSSDAVCGLHCAHGDEERGFLGSASKPRSMVYRWIGIKLLDGFLEFGIKTGGDGFLQFGLKTGGDGSLVWHQNRWRQFALV